MTDDEQAMEAEDDPDCVSIARRCLATITPTEEGT
jgi:hypothetical protein